ncbi:hypothetical protein N7468_003644 [Penicillium chermesinum]|uniref:C2H2-type domain-containing protein n=1 Tax=Penicillium chermesinum TaxID=63820 RepID=A0A9W9P7C6_9EURO|nr:uncharacterized protein N7468_003644 [Penicillium chermesinum]KAJ5239025.1 hypothetical protein N7468_003644 [Penicillium chermesinum]
MSTKRGVGRPKKAAHSETDAESPPSYPVFRCGMKDCMAELHNLSFLQTHCLKIHIPYSLTCQWEGCDDQTPRPAAAMWRHTREKHIKPIAWQLGDGPAAPSSGELPSIQTTLEDLLGSRA